jgi:hypothetical protein
MYTQEEFEEDVAGLEEQRHKIRLLIVAASESGNPWRRDGLESKRIDDALLRKIEECEQRRKIAKFAIANAIEQRRLDKNAGKKPSKGGLQRREKYGYMYKTITQPQAMALKHKGFEVQMIGRDWRVKVS